MKLQVLPNPDSTSLAGCEKNSTTQVLATAVYSKLEHHFFDDTLSRMDIASAFRCNISQLSKAVTGIDYTSGPHSYKPKEKKTLQRGQVINQIRTWNQPRRHHVPLPTQHIQPHLSPELWRNKIQLFLRTHCQALVIVVTYPPA